MSMEEHGYVLDHGRGHVVEAATGYAGCAVYRGLPLNLPAVEDWLETRDDPRNGALWTAIWEAVEATGEPYRLPRSFRWPRRIVERP